MRKKLREWISVQLVKNPGRIVIGAILLFNILFFLLSAFVISRFSLDGTEKMGFLEAAFCTVTMILDAGCIQFVIADIGSASVGVAVFCLAVVLIGMISFTGAVIGYLTNYISSFIENANAGKHRLRLADHIVILNWNNRASEIVNDLLYCRTRQDVVVLVMGRKDEIEQEISERLSDTIERENRELLEKCRALPWPRRIALYLRERYRNNVSVIVKVGDVFSSKQLHDISLEKARSVILLGKDKKSESFQASLRSDRPGTDGGSTHVIKTLMQVADITAAEYSEDRQKIVVEVEDDWTWDLVQKIIQYKQIDGKCNIVPVRVNQILGQLLSQFALMPELNQAYRELFSNKGAAFFSRETPQEPEDAYLPAFLADHPRAIPLTFMDSRGRSYFYCVADQETDMDATAPVPSPASPAALNRDYWIEQKNVILLGHNSKCVDIMKGFEAFRMEWGRPEEEIVRVVVIDDAETLRSLEHYKAYPFVVETVEADIWDRDRICSTIERVLAGNPGDTSILILSDDSAPAEELDARAFANLIYVQDIINKRVQADPDFDKESIDVIVEIIDPKHYDIVSSYSVDNVVISNRFISKMITQIGEKEALFDFYRDILTYDEAVPDGQCYVSKEVYIKQVRTFFSRIPGPCTAAELIRAVYSASVDPALPPSKRYPTVTLGYVRPGGQLTLFSGDQTDLRVELAPEDKLVVFSNH